ncbi:LOW QUALITY PROTEIN: protein mono-ADP-ribosyltransferase PARP4 [Sarcoramphus papa]
MAIFENCVFFIKVKYLQEKSRLKASIKENGGVVNFVLNHKSTHALVDTADVLSCCDLKNIKYQLPVLCAAFIKSVEKGKLSQIDAYKVDKSDDTSDRRPDKQDVEDLSSAENKNATKKNENNNSNLTVIEDSERRIESKLGTLRFYNENDQDTPFFPQDFEVAKYNVLEKVNSKESKDFVVIELQCSQEHYKFPFRLYAHFSASNGTKNNKQFVTNTAEEIKYKTFIADLKSQDFLLRETFPPEAESLASTKLQELLLEEAIHSSAVCQEVSDFVELIWAEAVGHLDSLLLESVNNISLNDVSKAEGILLQVKNALYEGAGEVALEMMMEFYQVVHHKTEIDYKVSKKLLSRRHDLCQVTFPDCYDCPVRILQVCRVGRIRKTAEFLSSVGNISLFHALFVCNFMGVFSRGLLMPKVAVEDHGLERTDIGNLGSGTYFSDSSANIKYSSPSEMDGTRLLAVCDVALGSCLDLYERDYSLNNAPSGYDSVHGVHKTADISSDVEDEEFVVYKTCQVKIRYVVKFCLAEDQIKPFQPAIGVELEQDNNEPESQCHLHESYALPNANLSNPVKTDLQDRLGNPVPLEGVYIKARITDFVAQDAIKKVCVKQVPQKNGFSMDISIEMPSSIERIHNWTHKLKGKKTNCKAVIKTVENSSLDVSGFVLDIWISSVYLPQMWVEKLPNKMKEACMLVFQPEFETAFEEEQLSSEIIILLDCSNSVAGSALHQAKQIALRVLELFCFRQRVNVVKFGTDFTEFSSFSMNIINDLASPKEFITSATATLGNTALWKTLHYLTKQTKIK